MTHDELFIDVSEVWNWYEDQEQFAEVAPYLLALRAVIELHKPIEVDEKYDKGLFCGCCEASVPMHRVPLQEYPCLTIQAIEKKLQ